MPMVRTKCPGTPALCGMHNHSNRPDGVQNGQLNAFGGHSQLEESTLKIERGENASSRYGIQHFVNPR